MSAFVLANVRIDDRERFVQDYQPLAQIAVERAGGRVLVAGDVEPAEGDLPLDQVVVIEFTDVAQARAYLASPEYAAAKAERDGIGLFRIVLLHGTDEPRVSSSSPGYLLADTDLINPDGIERHLSEYAPIGRGLMKEYGGHVIGVSSDNILESNRLSGPPSPPYPDHGADPPEAIEGDWDLHRVLFHEYPSVEAARGFVTSDGWNANRPLRQSCGTYRVVVLRTARSPADSLL